MKRFILTSPLSALPLAGVAMPADPPVIPVGLDAYPLAELAWSEMRYSACSFVMPNFKPR